MTQTIKLKCTVNGTPKSADCHTMARLLDVIREDFKLTGTKEGCGEGECGACSVLLNCTLVNSCLIPAAQAQGATITTIEGVATSSKAEDLHPVQQAFLKAGGAQCGICTPGMIMAAVTLVENNTRPTDDQIKEALAGNLCRCTGYTKIFDAMRMACDQMANGKGSR